MFCHNVLLTIVITEEPTQDYLSVVLNNWNVDSWKCKKVNNKYGDLFKIATAKCNNFLLYKPTYSSHQWFYSLVYSSGSQPGVHVPPGVSEKSEGLHQKFKVVDENEVKCHLSSYQRVKEF